jgi:TatA/E family protein of Tat protein translocase
MAAEYRMLSIPHLVVIFVVALVVFGPEKIPELARNLGKIMAEFRRVTGDLRSTFEGHLRDLEREADTRRIAATVPAPTVVPTVPTAEATAATAPSLAPGTVPSNPPNAAAVAEKPEADSSASSNNSIPGPSDPMHDPYLMHMDFPVPDSAAESEPSDSEPKTERVTDGDGRAS